jgi:hypothetical protein
MRTVSVHVMWDAQEKITSRPESICGMTRTAPGASYGGEDPLCHQVSEGTGAKAPRHRSPPAHLQRSLSPCPSLTLSPALASSL